MGQAASSRMVGRLRRRSHVASRMVVVEYAARVGPRASSRMVGRLLPGQLVPGDVVVSNSTGLGTRASSRMVGRRRRRRLVSRGWWWQQRRDWVLQNHPEWWGDTW